MIVHEQMREMRLQAGSEQGNYEITVVRRGRQE